LIPLATDYALIVYLDTLLGFW